MLSRLNIYDAAGFRPSREAAFFFRLQRLIGHRRRRPYIVRITAVCVAVALYPLTSCSTESVKPPFEPTQSHSAYRDAIQQLDLGSTALGSGWIDAEARGMRNPIPVTLPIEVLNFFDPSVPEAIVYRFSAAPGRRISIEIESVLEVLFVDLFRVAATETSDPIHVASRDPLSGEIEFVPRRAGEYLLRLQPELLRGGRITVRMIARSALSFPVEGAGAGRIGSFFGDPRDGGSRRHEGLDIFSARGTLALAASDSFVSRVSVRERGGNVVFLYDEKLDLRIYYAHLDTQLVRQGQLLKAGDVVGTVGNTGNAITTPPHLHLGLYRGGWGGAVDPWNYFVDPPTIEPDPLVHSDMIGQWYRVVESIDAPAGLVRELTTEEIKNRNTDGEIESLSPVASTQIIGGSAVIVTGGSGKFLRIKTPNGRSGYVVIEDLGSDTNAHVLSEPGFAYSILDGSLISELQSGTRVSVIGNAINRQVVRLDSGLICTLDLGERALLL